MNKLEFSFQMQRVIDTFDKKKDFYSNERMDSIWVLAEPLDAKDFQAVVSGLIERMREKPLPEDFRKAAAPFRRTFAKPHLVQNQEYKPDCGHCFDLGFIQVIFRDDSFKSLARCVCSTGQAYPQYFIPTWEPKMASAFVWQPIPRDWFPVGGDVTPDALMGSKGVKAWLGRLKFADELWRNMAKSKGGKESQQVDAL